MRIEVETCEEKKPDKDERAQVWKRGEIPHWRSSNPKLI